MDSWGSRARRRCLSRRRNCRPANPDACLLSFQGWAQARQTPKCERYSNSKRAYILACGERAGAVYASNEKQQPVQIRRRAQVNGLRQWRVEGPRVGSRVVRFDVSEMRPSAGQPHRLQASVFDSLQRPVSTAGVKWSLRGATSGTVDSLSGVMIAARAGAVTVQARSGVELRDEAILTVQASESSATWSEDWADSALSRWYRIGWPDSRVVATPDGRTVFLNNGDGSYGSGVVSRDAFGTAAGLAMEATVSSRAPRLQWQQARFALLSAIDTAGYERAGGRNAPPYVSRDAILCDVAWPGENDGADSGPRRVSVSNSSSALRAALASSATSGRWMTVRLQLLPDVRCGVALDGEPIVLLPIPTAHAPNVHLLITGNSYKTQILVGPVKVLRGVPGDIDWSKVP